MKKRIVVGLLLAAAITALWPSGCGRLSVEEELKGGKEPYAKRTTKSMGGAPWSQNPPVLNKQGELSVDKGGASSGGTSWKIVAASGTAPLYIIGGLVVVAGIVLIVIFKAYWTGIITIAAGAGLIVFVSLVDTYPIVFLFLLIGAVGVGAYYLYTVWRGKKFETVATNIIAAVKAYRKAHPESWDYLAKELAANINSTEKALVDKLDATVVPRKSGD